MQLVNGHCCKQNRQAIKVDIVFKRVSTDFSEKARGDCKEISLAETEVLLIHKSSYGEALEYKVQSEF